MSTTSTKKNLTAEIVELLSQNPEITADALRKEALAAFSALGLPTLKNEEFKHTPILRELEQAFGEGFYYAAPLAPFEPKAIDGVDTYSLVFINGKFVSGKSSFPQGISVMPLSDALKTQPAAIKYFSKITNYKTNAFTAWNTAAWKDGLFISVPKNVTIEKPILLHYINDGKLAHESWQGVRNLIVCEQSSEVTLIEKFDSSGNPLFLNLINEVEVSENAKFSMYSIHNDMGARYQYTHTEIHQNNNSNVNTYAFTLDGKLIRNNLHLQLDGEGCESHMYGLYLLHGETVADNHTVADHRKPNSFSNELYKGVLEGSSKGIFNGKIFVRPDAQKTNAFQSNRNILLSEKATINTKPQLEIWADDVKCSHGCTTGQLDEEALFYLRSRGVDKNTARAMMLYAFAAEVLENIPNEKLKTFIDALVSERLHKNF